jgi:hypothetical protein
VCSHLAQARVVRSVSPAPVMAVGAGEQAAAAAVCTRSRAGAGRPGETRTLWQTTSAACATTATTGLKHRRWRGPGYRL